MYRDDEPLDDRRYHLLSSGQQAALIDRYCRGIEEQIRNAGSFSEAMVRAEEACGAFEKECPSDIIRRMLLQRVRAMVNDHWPGEA